MPERGNVVDLPFSGHWRPEQCLGDAGKRDLAEVVVIGFDNDGCFHILYGDKDGEMVRRDVLWLLTQAQRLIEG